MTHEPRDPKHGHAGFCLYAPTTRAPVVLKSVVCGCAVCQSYFPESMLPPEAPLSPPAHVEARRIGVLDHMQMTRNCRRHGERPVRGAVHQPRVTIVRLSADEARALYKAEKEKRRGAP